MCWVVRTQMYRLNKQQIKVPKILSYRIVQIEMNKINITIYQTNHPMHPHYLQCLVIWLLEFQRYTSNKVQFFFLNSVSRRNKVSCKVNVHFIRTWKAKIRVFATLILTETRVFYHNLRITGITLYFNFNHALYYTFPEHICTFAFISITWNTFVHFWSRNNNLVIWVF